MNRFFRVIEGRDHSSILCRFNGWNKVAVARNDDRMTNLVRPTQPNQFHSHEDVDPFLLKRSIPILSELSKPHLKPGQALDDIPKLAITCITDLFILSGRFSPVRHAIIEKGTHPLPIATNCGTKPFEIDSHTVGDYFG